jgi:NADH-quinone oxidoreductase subunit N
MSAAGGTHLDSVLIAAVLAMAALVIAASSDTLRADDAGVRIASLATLAAVASSLVASSHDLLMLFLAVETLALLGYGMVAIADTPRARESAMKWFIQGSIATVFFIVGIAVLIGLSGGQTGYIEIVDATRAMPALARTPFAVGIVFVLAALLFKAGAFPFHSWMLDAFESAPPAATAILASVGKIGPIAAIVYVAAAQYQVLGSRMDLLIAAVSLLSIVFGNLAALRQRSLARMLAYSGVAQIGYALMGVLLYERMTSVLLFGVLYAAAAAGAFLVIVALREGDPEWDGSIRGLAGLSRRRPVLAVSLGVMMFSLTGIPLTAGFWGKYLVFVAALSSGYLWLVVVAMLGSVVSFGYYGGVLRAAFMEEAAGENALPDPAPDAPAPRARNVPATAGVALVAAALVAVGVLPFAGGLAWVGALFH